jgi:hypothetical protein
MMRHVYLVVNSEDGSTSSVWADPGEAIAYARVDFGVKFERGSVARLRAGDVAFGLDPEEPGNFHCTVEKRPLRRAERKATKA